MLASDRFIGFRSLFLNTIIYFSKSGPYHNISGFDYFLYGVDETEPMLLFTIYHQIAWLHENHELDFREIPIKLILNLKVVQVNFGLVDIAIDLPLINYSFICLGDDSNKIV